MSDPDKMQTSLYGRITPYDAVVPLKLCRTTSKRQTSNPNGP